MMKNKDNANSVPLLSTKNQQILLEQVIDDDGPGTVLHDFEKILDFIGPDGVGVSGKYKFFPLKLLPQLNTQMAHPISIDLKRPVQKSYPYINGLYLVLRASGIVMVEGLGSRQTMVIDNAVLQSWQTLNPVERYLTLFEIWMLKGNPEIIGEHGSLVDTPFTTWVQFFGRIPKKGLKIAGNKEEEIFIIYFPKLYTLALLDLFGLVAIQHAKPEKGKGWRIAWVNRTPLGDALLSLITPYFTSEDYYHDKFSGEDKLILSSLQSILQPFFPKRRNSLIIPEAEFQDGIHVFKVSLGSTWRRIVMPAKMDFDTFSSCILEAFDFDHDHLYMFSYVNRFGILEHLNDPYGDEPPYASEVLIGELSLKPGEVISYLFDFGDNWEFDVKLERIDPADKKIKGPVMLESYGEAPDQYPDWDEY
jgi:hypothetical protein